MSAVFDKERDEIEARLCCCCGSAGTLGQYLSKEGVCWAHGTCADVSGLRAVDEAEWKHRVQHNPQLWDE